MFSATFTLLTWTLAQPALAVEVEQYRWDLALQGQVVGQRDLTVKYRSDGRIEVRVLESYTELNLPLDRDGYLWQQRLSGLARTGSASFASVISDDGWNREVQAVKKVQGWTVTVAEGDEARAYLLDRDAFDLTSLDLIDPGQGDRLDGRTHLRVLVAETGEVLEGPLERTGQVQVRIEGVAVPGVAYRWNIEEGPVELIYGREGHLLRYAIRIAGVSVSATLAEPPAARTFEEELPGPLIGPPVVESEL